ALSKRRLPLSRRYTMNLRFFSSTEYFHSSTDHLQSRFFSTSLIISWDTDSAGAVRCAWSGRADPHNTSRLTMRRSRMLGTSQKMEGVGCATNLPHSTRRRARYKHFKSVWCAEPEALGRFDPASIMN